MFRARKSGVSFGDLSSQQRELSVDDLVGLEVTLEYKDAMGEQSTRAVRILEFQGDMLFCRCHLRKDQRSFRIDRIKAVIDQDGEVLSAREFLRLFGIKGSRAKARVETGNKRRRRADSKWDSNAVVVATALLLILIVLIARSG